MTSLTVLRTNRQMEQAYRNLARDLLNMDPFDRGEVHAQKVTQPEMVTMEVRHVRQYFFVDHHPEAWAETVKPNLPWAEDHFLERVSGEPLNPPPAESWWPYAQQGNAAHKEGEKFSHTYPERFWPKRAGEYWSKYDLSAYGIRFPYGDLDDLVDILVKNPRSRQAYLPVWFPEDLAAAKEGKRVPCTLGYHFLMNPEFELDIVYNMRSCDFVRFYRDDIYMAGRLLQWVVAQHNERAKAAGSDFSLVPGELVMNIDNLHCFVGDRPHLESLFPKVNITEDPRANYDFGALY